MGDSAVLQLRLQTPQNVVRGAHQLRRLSLQAQVSCRRWHITFGAGDGSAQGVEVAIVINAFLCLVPRLVTRRGDVARIEDLVVEVAFGEAASLESLEVRSDTLATA